MRVLLRRSGYSGLSFRHHSFGQALVEFAVVFPIFMLILGGIIQFGMIFAGQNSLNQIARDTGRWAATQIVAPCRDITTLVPQANSIALSSSLIGYTNNEWTDTGGGANYTAHPLAYNVPSGTSPWPPGTMAVPSIEAVWFTAAIDAFAAGPCPPTDNQKVWYVAIRVTHKVPTFFPLIPGDGVISTTTQFRMEPKP